MTPDSRPILTINAGSSSIKFALFDGEDPVRRVLNGKIEGIGFREGRLAVKSSNQTENVSRPVVARDHTVGIAVVMDWVQERMETSGLAAVGHRVVHGGPNFWEPQRITPELIEALKELSPFDPEHMPQEIGLIEAFRHRFPDLPQVACFDTAFHHDLPAVARLLPIPRRYEAKGVRRYGFHGLSYSYLMEELTRLSGIKRPSRVVLAHLGNGASLAAVRDGQSIDTSMAFTPASGLPMSTRAGDLDPGLAWYLARTENMMPREFNEMVNRESGLLGVSEMSGDLRALLDLEGEDSRAAEAIALFSYQVKKWIGAFAAALGGVDTIVFSGGIGENAPVIRWRICEGLGFLGICLDPKRNEDNAPVISKDESPVTVRVIPADEEVMIARSVLAVINHAHENEQLAIQ